jgi:hypothetical protein
MKRSKSASRPKKRPAKQPPPATLLRQIGAQGILLPRRDELLVYLRRHRDLAALLPDICGQVVHEFGLNYELSLELYKDPEIDDRYLTLYVRSATFDARVMDQIEAACSRYDERLGRVSGYLLITTDFKRSRGNHAV